MTPEDQAEILKDWLKHPGTRIMARKVRVASLGLLRRYDSATPEKVAEIQIARWFFNEELPRMIEAAMNPGLPKSKRTWHVKTWIKRIIGAR